MWSLNISLMIFNFLGKKFAFTAKYINTWQEPLFSTNISFWPNLSLTTTPKEHFTDVSLFQRQICLFKGWIFVLKDIFMRLFKVKRTYIHQNIRLLCITFNGRTSHLTAEPTSFMFRLSNSNCYIYLTKHF